MKIKRASLSLGFLAVFWVLSAEAATFTVTKTADTADGACDADCSLREAVIAANAAPGGDSINLPFGTFLLTRAGDGEDLSLTGDLDVTDDLSITGSGVAGATVIDVDGAGDRLLHVLSGGVTLSSLVLKNGRVLDADGGAVLKTGPGNLTVSYCQVRNSIAQRGGGIALTNGNLILLDSTVADNIANGSGGGVFQEGESLLIGNTTV
ncbi:MAG TPA: CSLREA domain-containing protein, partial [bacterium]|nr:CSLREA domain-containing protein [bacterium]